MNRLCVSIFVVIVVCSNFDTIGATICKPNSRFKVDCNTCTCSNDGTKYSCEESHCVIDNEKKYDIKFTKDGYKIFVPKTTARLNNDERLYTGKQRLPRVVDGHPLGNDEIYVPVPGKDIKKFDDPRISVGAGRRLIVADIHPTIHKEKENYDALESLEDSNDINFNIAEKIKEETQPMTPE